MAVVYNASIERSGLLIHLDAANVKSYPRSGTIWTDLSGSNNHGTIDGATWSSENGGMFDFNGSNNSVSVAHTSSLSLSTTSQKTIQVWVKFDTLPALNAQIPVFGKLSSSYGFDGYWAGLFSNGGVVRSVTNGTSVQKVSNSTSTISIDTWYLYTFISQITSTANTTKVYINETEYITTAHGSDSYSESNPFYLGYIGAGVSSPYLNGKISTCYFYNRALSVSEISKNFNALRGRFGV